MPAAHIAPVAAIASAGGRARCNADIAPAAMVPVADIAPVAAGAIAADATAAAAAPAAPPSRRIGIRVHFRS